MNHAFHQVRRTLGAFALIVAATTGLAAAGIQVNKSFAPNSVALGGSSTVTVTLQNDSTASAANITAFSDDIATTMGGHATLATSPVPTTTCAGGTPTAAAGIVTMNNGHIPIAPSSSVTGSCTITFTVTGAVAGNGFNTIAAADVVTSLGSPTSDVTQTLAVVGTNVTTPATSPGSVQIADTSTVTYVITNAAAVALTNATFPIAASATLAFTLNAFTTSCGGTATLPATGTTGTATFSGLLVPAAGTCTVTLSVTTPNVTTVNFTLAAGGVVDDQGATNAVGVSAQAKFVSGQPNVTSSFSPSAVIAGNNSTLAISIANVLTDKPLTNAAFSDTLPATLTLVSISANANCGSPTFTGVGTGTFTVAAGTIATAATCIVSAVVNVPGAHAIGGVTNTVAAASFTSTEANGFAAASSTVLQVTGSGGGFSAGMVALPTSSPVSTPVKITLTFTSLAGGAFTGGSFSDVLPQTPQTMIAYADATHVTSSTCGSSPSVTYAGNLLTVYGSGLTLAASSSCTVVFWVEFTATTSVSRIDANQLLAANATFTGSAGTVNLAATASVNITELPTLSVTSYVASNSGLRFQPLTVSATINDASGTTDTGASAVFNLTAGSVALATPANFTFSGCPSGLSEAGNIVATTNREQFTITIPSINATCTIGFQVIDEAGALGTFTPANGTYTSALTGGNPVSQTGVNNVTFVKAALVITKSFTPNQIQSGGTSTADIALTVPQAGTLAQTTANGIAFSDALPTNLNFATTPNVTFGPGCQQSGQPAPGSTITGSTIAFTNISLITINAVMTTCDVTFVVTSNVVGAPLNQIPANAITSTSLATNSQVAKASLTVNAGLGIQKTFLSTTLQIGATDYVRLLLTNSASTVALSGGTLVDAMGSSLVLASTVLGPRQAGDPVLCGGSVSGTNTITLSGLAVAASTGVSTPGQCVVYVQVAASASAVPGVVINTIAVGGLNLGGFSNQTASSGNVTLTAPVAPAIAKSFLPAVVQPNGTTVLTVSIANTANGAAALNGVALTDTLPPGLTIAATPNAVTTCPAGTATASAGTASLALSGASLAANATCTLSANVTGASAASYTNTIAANALTSMQGATNAGAASATLLIASSIGVSEAFAPANIAAGATSMLTVTLPNTAGGAIALSGIALSNALPSGVTIAATPNAATTCGAGTVTAAAGGTTVALANGDEAAGASCTITVSVTGTLAGVYTDTIAANALSTAQGISNAAAATANLTIALAGITLSAGFAPVTIAAGATSLLTITIPNTAPGAVALTALTLSDALPPGITIAATPNAATTCGAGTVSAVAGGASAALAGGTLAANATCTITVSVTGTLAANYTDTIAPGALTSTQAVTNPAPASAGLTIVLNGSAVSKAFSPATILAGATSLLTITIPNTATGAVALSGAALTDALPAGLTIAAVPNAATTCGAGAVIAAAGTASIALSNGSLAANATCTISANVTGTIAASYTNTIPANALTTTQAVSNTAPATANLSIGLNGIMLGQAFSPATIAAGGTAVLTITVPNTAAGAVALSAVALSDALPPGVTIAAVPNAVTTCGAGTLTAVAGSATVSLAGGSLAANASCTISVNVTGTVAATDTNTIPANALATTQGVTNPAPVSANLTIALNGSAVSMSFSPATILAGATSLLTITIPNTAAGAIALSGAALTDALPSGVTIAATPNAATTCGAGTVTAAAGAASIALASGSLAANATCTITVNVTGTIAATYTNTIPANALTTTQAVSNAAPATANLTIGLNGITLSKAFSPLTILAGGTSNLTITIPNTATGAVALANVALSDALPPGMTIAATPNATTSCGAGSVTATAGSAVVSLANGAIAANATCTLSVDVTATTVAAYTNTIAGGALVTAQGVSNAVPATAGLTVNPASTALSEGFAPVSIAAGAVSTLTITIPNTAAGAVALSGLTLSDTLPAGLTIASTPNATTNCGAGTITATAGGTVLVLANGTLAANATCMLTISVTASTAAAYTNTTPAGALGTTQGISNAAPASAALTVTLNGISLSEAFAPASISAGGNATLTITIPNTATGAVALTGLTLGDTLPAGLTIAATPNATTSCGAGTLTAGAGSATVALAGGSLAANATCTVTVSVTAITAAAYTNTIPAGALATTQGVSNAAPASAGLTVTLNGITLTQAFSPGTIVAGSTSLLTIAIPNTATGAVSLSGITLGDTLPAGLSIAAVPAAATTCGAGTVSATAGSSSAALANGSLAAGATCTITVNVTAIAAATYTNAISANAVVTTQGVSNAVATSANLTVTQAGLILSAAFAPVSIPVGGTSVLTISIPNTSPGALALSALALADALPVGTTVAAVPNATTTCAGSASATAGGTNLTLSGGTLAAGATCTLGVNVTSSVLGPHTNTIPAAALGDAQGATNSASASAALTVVAAPPVTLGMSFNAAVIPFAGTSVLTLTIANTAAGAGPLSSVALSDSLPAGVTIAAAPNASTTCGSATLTAAAGATALSLAGATIAANATCTLVVTVTSSTPGLVTNTVASGAVTSTQGASNGAPANATLTVLPAPSVTLSAAYALSTITAGGTSTLTITIVNAGTGAQALSGIALPDTMPSGTVVAATPNASTTCGSGVLSAVAGSGQIHLTGGMLAANATCTIAVDVTGALAGTYVDIIPVNAVSSAQGAANAAAAQATLTIVNAALQVVKTSNASSAGIAPGGTIVYTIVVTNPAAIAETHATIADTLANATLVPGSVSVNGVAVADNVIASAASFGTIAAASHATIVYTTTVNTAAVPGGSVTNTAIAGGDQPCTGNGCSSSAQPVAIVAPTLSVVVTIDGQQSEKVVAGQIVTYTMVVTNTSGVNATNVVLVDDAPTGATPISGTVTLNGQPDAIARSTRETLSGASVTGQLITVPIGTIVAGGTATIAFRATIGNFGSAQLVNSATVSANGLPSQVFSNKVFAQMVSGTLSIAKTASASVVTVGDRVNYTIAVAPPSGVTLGVTTLRDTLPNYEAYAPGSARVGGVALEPVSSGHTLTWTLPALPATITIAYATAITAGAQSNSVLTNIVTGSSISPGGAPPATGTASASVQVVGTTFGSCYPITGRVFVDLHDASRYDDGDPGVGDVRIYLDDGESVITDPHGRYDFPCVRPGMHALLLDTSTLPAGVKEYGDRRLDSVHSTRRLVHSTLDATILQDISFGLRAAPP